MGGRGSGTPVPIEKIDVVLDLLKEGVSLREACRRVGIKRDTVNRYRNNPTFRRVIQRCPGCGHMVRVPCLQCTITGEIQTREEWLQEQRAKGPAST